MRSAGRRPLIRRDRGVGADADQAALDVLAIRGVARCEPMFRRTLQNLDAEALDDAADCLCARDYQTSL